MDNKSTDPKARMNSELYKAMQAEAALEPDWIEKVLIVAIYYSDSSGKVWADQIHFDTEGRTPDLNLLHTEVSQAVLKSWPVATRKATPDEPI